MIGWVIVFAYLCFAGMVGRAVSEWRKKKGKDTLWETEFMVLASIFWPVMLPWFVGSAITGFVVSHSDRVSSRHDRKMAELKAEKEAAEAAIRLLEAEGWKVRVEQ